VKIDDEANRLSLEVTDGNLRGVATTEERLAQSLFCGRDFMRQPLIVRQLLDKRKNDRHVRFRCGPNLKTGNVDG
jgi:hypothetical protein